FSENEEEVFLGRSVTQSKHVSDATSRIIDEEVRAFIDIAEEKARFILTEHRDELEIIAQGLLEYETLSGKEVTALLKGEKITRKDDSNKMPKADIDDDDSVVMDDDKADNQVSDKGTGQES
ncbi:MAG: cell division protein FtsH, partial [Ghiorsea sp.]|nr:cell division protein FtsH [Ghiorsea sp.]